MGKYVYIKRGVGDGYVSFDTPLSQELNGNDIGTTFQDYQDGKWVLLRADQVAFREAHPMATIKNVWDMEEPEPVVRTLEDAKRERIEQIDAYDSSPCVNEFTVNEIPMWLDKATRAGLLLRITAEQAMGEQVTTLWFGTMSFEIPVAQAFQMLYSLEIYASGCYDRTAAHKAAVEALDSIEDVDAYDYVAGYPEKLVFTL